MRVGILHQFQRIPEKPLPAKLTDQAHLDASELASSRDHVETGHTSDNRVRRGRPAREHVDEVHTDRTDLKPELTRQRELRIRVNNEHLTRLSGKEHREIRSRCRLPRSDETAGEGARREGVKGPGLTGVSELDPGQIPDGLRREGSGFERCFPAKFSPKFPPVRRL